MNVSEPSISSYDHGIQSQGNYLMKLFHQDYLRSGSGTCMKRLENLCQLSNET